MGWKEWFLCVFPSRQNVVWLYSFLCLIRMEDFTLCMEVFSCILNAYTHAIDTTKCYRYSMLFIPCFMAVLFLIAGLDTTKKPLPNDGERLRL